MPISNLRTELDYKSLADKSRTNSVWLTAGIRATFPRSIAAIDSSTLSGREKPTCGTWPLGVFAVGRNVTADSGMVFRPEPEWR